MYSKLEHIAPDKITDLSEMREVLKLCLNIIESQANMLAKQSQEIEELKDEINRLKGEHGSLPPKVVRRGNSTTKKTGRTRKISIKRNNKKGGKKAKLIIDKIVDCEIDKTSLPKDAKLNSYQNLIQQDLIFKKHNTLFKVPIYYSKSAGRTYRGKLPPEYEGHFGGRLKGWVQLFHHYCDVTQSRLKALLKNIGVYISKGTINNILLSNSDAMKEESKDILRSGIEQIDYAQMDATKSWEAGQAKTTQIICTPYYSVYQTMYSRSRAHVIGALQGRIANDIPLYYDQLAIDALQASKVPQKDERLINQLLVLNQTYILEDFESILRKKAAGLLDKKSHNVVLAILACRYYKMQSDFPIITNLLTDAGHEYAKITDHQALCWLHEERHYKKMVPRIKIHQKILELFREQIWSFYAKLLAFKKEPPSQHNKLRQKLFQEFDQLFTQKTSYELLNKQIKRTFSRKKELLRVLFLPEIPIHNNGAELAVRRKVRKRDISLHTMSEQGTKSQDAFMSIVETAAKLGVNALDYLYDRITKRYAMTSLADLLRLKTN